MTAVSIGELRGCAAEHLAAYTEPHGRRAFRTYERLGDHDTLTPLDCRAPALLSVPVNWRQVIPLFQPTGLVRRCSPRCKPSLTTRPAAPSSS